MNRYETRKFYVNFFVAFSYIWHRCLLLDAIFSFAFYLTMHFTHRVTFDCKIWKSRSEIFSQLNGSVYSLGWPDRDITWWQSYYYVIAAGFCAIATLENNQIRDKTGSRLWYYARVWEIAEWPINSKWLLLFVQYDLLKIFQLLKNDLAEWKSDGYQSAFTWYCNTCVIRQSRIFM